MNWIITWNWGGDKMDVKKKRMKWRVEICLLETQIVTPRHTRCWQRTITYRQQTLTTSNCLINKNTDCKWHRPCRRSHPMARTTTTTHATTQPTTTTLMVIKTYPKSMIDEKATSSRDRMEKEVVHMITRLIMQSLALQLVLESKGRGQMQARKQITVSWAFRRRLPVDNPTTKMARDRMSHLIKSGVVIRS